MCGIVGAVADRNIVPLLLEGLKRLEYRGYDSCGAAVYQNGLKRSRSVLRVAELKEEVKLASLEGMTGISHTRWATHGAPNIGNAHPHFSHGGDGEPRIALVHNGIIENYQEIREELKASGYIFASSTDTEVIVHLINDLYDGDLLCTVQRAVKLLSGAFAIAVFCKDEPNRIVGARQGCPLVVGIGQNENFLASDALALAGTTDRIIYLEDGDVVDLQRSYVSITDRNDHEVSRAIHTIQPEIDGCSDLGPYQHYMQKEIFEQSQAIATTLESITAINCEIFGETAATVFKNIDSIQILACGTSYYAGLTAKYWIESMTGIPTQVEVASEYRYRKPAINKRALVLVISQSGETADTLAALKYAQSVGQNMSLAICNVASSAMVRETTLCYLTKAGIEIGVASTKAFTTQLVALYLLALTLAKSRGHLPPAVELDQLNQLRRLPDAVQQVLALEPKIVEWANTLAKHNSVLFLGRGLHYPIALEGALKLKEISYIHAEAYPAGELKHGPLALVTAEMPVVVLAPNDQLIEKLKSNIQEVHARGGPCYVFADENSSILADEHLHVMRLPSYDGTLSPILHVVCLQLLAYHTALARHTDVDKPRNLAKSVTVE